MKKLWALLIITMFLAMTFAVAQPLTLDQASYSLGYAIGVEDYKASQPLVISRLRTTKMNNRILNVAGRPGDTILLETIKDVDFLRGYRMGYRDAMTGKGAAPEIDLQPFRSMNVKVSDHYKKQHEKFEHLSRRFVMKGNAVTVETAITGKEKGDTKATPTVGEFRMRERTAITPYKNVRREYNIGHVEDPRAVSCEFGKDKAESDFNAGNGPIPYTSYITNLNRDVFRSVYIMDFEQLDRIEYSKCYRMKYWKLKAQ